MRKYLLTVLSNGAGKVEEWVEWSSDHVADMIKMPGFIGCQSFRARPDFTFTHEDTLASLPPYEILTCYEVNEEGLGWLTTKRRDAGVGPEAGTRSFPTPLGDYVGNTFLWEATSPEYQVYKPQPSKRFLVMSLTAGGAKFDEWAKWGMDHVAEMITLPSAVRNQSFRIRSDFSYDHPETVASKPPYDMMTLHEVDDAGVKLMTETQPMRSFVRTGTAPFPTPPGPHIRDTYFWEATSAEFKAIRE